jgi:hypothetical protein
MVVLVILAVIGLVTLVAVLRLLWRAARGGHRDRTDLFTVGSFGRSKNEPR